MQKHIERIDRQLAEIHTRREPPAQLWVAVTTVLAGGATCFAAGAAFAKYLWR